MRVLTPLGHFLNSLITYRKVTKNGPGTCPTHTTVDPPPKKKNTGFLQGPNTSSKFAGITNEQNRKKWALLHSHISKHLFEYKVHKITWMAE